MESDAGDLLDSLYEHAYELTRVCDGVFVVHAAGRGQDIANMGDTEAGAQRGRHPSAFHRSGAPCGSSCSGLCHCAGQLRSAEGSPTRLK